MNDNVERARSAGPNTQKRKNVRTSVGIAIETAVSSDARPTCDKFIVLFPRIALERRGCEKALKLGPRLLNASHFYELIRAGRGK